MMNQLTPQQALARLQDFCSRAEMSTGEALERLHRWGVCGLNAEKVVQRLVDERFIDDERFARAFVRDKYMYSKWGRVKIRQALRLKRVDREYVDVAIQEEIDPEVYAEALTALLRAKYRQIPADDDLRTVTGKLLRFVAARGYEPALAIELIREGVLDELD